MLRIEVHLPGAYVATDAGGGDAAVVPAELSIELTALGDFEASTQTSKIAPGDSRGLPLPFPGSTRAVSASADGFVGVGSALGGGNIDVLLWRSKQATQLWPAPQADFPKQVVGAAFGLDLQRRHVLVAGSSSDTADASRAFTLDLGTGAANEVVDGMLPARAFATVSAFGPDSMLVAGGVDPRAGDVPLASASVFHLKSARFDRAKLVTLAQPRTRHAAVLLASGETLLVGGAGPNGSALATLEAVSPEDQASRIAGLATLARPRIGPVALRLSDDRVFVGGGSDATGPVGVLEWLSPDAHALVLIQENLVLAPAHAFAPMPGGSVLGVGVCVPKGVQSCLGEAAQKSVVWLRADGAADVLPPLAFSPASVALVAAGDGAPWLHAKTSATTEWKRFDPWTGRFDEPEERPALGPDADLPAPLGVDAGAFVWLERGTPAVLAGFRHDVRGPYARDVAPLLLAGREHVSPNRLPSGVSKSGIEYSAAGLGLAGDDVLAVVTDTTYADVDLELTLTSGPAPVVVLGTTRLGAAECAWPSPEPAEAGEIVQLRRRGTRVTLERRGARRSCDVAGGRLGVGLSAPGPEPSFVRALEIHRR